MSIPSASLNVPVGIHHQSPGPDFHRFVTGTEANPQTHLGNAGRIPFDGGATNTHVESSVCRQSIERSHFSRDAMFTGLPCSSLSFEEGQLRSAGIYLASVRRQQSRNRRPGRSSTSSTGPSTQIPVERDADADRAVFEHAANLLRNAHKVSLSNGGTLAAKETPYENDCALAYRNHYSDVSDVYSLAS